MPLPYRFDASPLPAEAAVGFGVVGLHVADEPVPPPVLHIVPFDVLFVGLMPLTDAEFWSALPPLASVAA